MTSSAIFNGYDKAQLDAQYNVLGRIPGYQPIYDRWQADSAKLRADCGDLAKIGLMYGDSPLQDLDLFKTSQPGRPLVIFIHGGYWRAHDKSWFSYVAKPYLDLNFNVAVINYRLTPAVTLDDIVSDVRGSVAWLYRNASTFQFNPQQIYVAGSSAGGHLTATLIGTDWRALGLPESPIKGGCALSGVYRLEPIRLCYLNEVIGLDAAMAKRNSPLLNVPDHAPELIVSVGGIESEEFQRQQNEFAAAWQDKGLRVRVVTQASGHHFDMIDRWADPKTELFQNFVAMIGSGGS